MSGVEDPNRRGDYSKVGALLATTRPRQWVKNGFVLAPLVFSKSAGQLDSVILAIAATASFCALSGSVYAFNDVRDLELDSAHPQKRFRPLASGALSKKQALWLSFVLALAALLAAFAISLFTGACALAYLANNLGYCLWLKRIPLLDVVSISVGFMLRVGAGATAISVVISNWLLLCTALLTMLLGFGKRAHELRTQQKSEPSRKTTRDSLEGYSLRTLVGLISALSIATVMAYALYTLDDGTVAAFHTERLIWSAPFCAFGVYRFVTLSLHTDASKSQSPTDAIVSDPVFLANIFLWAAFVVHSIYL